MSPLKTSSDLIVEFHRLYALTKNPWYLEIAAKLGTITLEDYERIWRAKVNAGCDKQGIPHIYPVDNAPLPTTKDV